MKSAFNDIIYEKRGIYGVLHVIILLLSLFLIVVISVDTFKNIPFMTQGSYLKIQFWICMFFIADFVLEFFLSKRKLYYLQTHFIFLWRFQIFTRLSGAKNIAPHLCMNTENLS